MAVFYIEIIWAEPKVINCIIRKSMKDNFLCSIFTYTKKKGLHVYNILRPFQLKISQVVLLLMYSIGVI